MVNIYKLKLTVLQQEILRVLFINVGKPLNQRRLSKIIGVSQPAIGKALPELEKFSFIKLEQDRESKRWSIELDKSNHGVIQSKRVDNLKQVYESGLMDFLEKEFAGGVVVLFGSYSRGEDVINSDIDIAIIGRKEKMVRLEKYEKILCREINLNFYSSFGKIHKNLKENIFNGIVLVGGIEL